MDQPQWEFCQLRLVGSAMVQDQGMRHTLWELITVQHKVIAPIVPSHAGHLRG